MKEFNWVLRGRCYRLGHDVPHAGVVIPQWLIDGRFLDPKDLIPHLFEEVDPGFHERAKAGDIIVAGRNFGMGPKMNGYVAMQALDLGIVCESMPYLAYRAAVGCGVRTLTNCTGVIDTVETGDEIEVNFATGDFLNHTRNERHAYPCVPNNLKELIALGGNKGWLRQWREQNPQAGG